MDIKKILNYLKVILPLKEIGSFLIGLIVAMLATALSMSSTELKAQYCKSDTNAIIKSVKE